MTQVKGSNMVYARAFADRRLPADGWTRVIARLSSEDRAALDGVIASGWYDLSLQHRVFAALDEALRACEPDVIAAYARYTAEQDLTRVHRLFLRFRNPALVLEKSAEYWGRFYDAGTWKTERLTETAARGELSGISELAPVFCRFLTAYIERMFQLAGANNGVVSHTRCACRGAPSCLFEGRWQS